MNYKDFVNSLPGIMIQLSSHEINVNNNRPVYVMFDGIEWEVSSVEEDDSGTIRIHLHDA